MAKNGISTISWNTCRLVSWQLLLLLPPRLRLSKRRETRRLENISMMELFRFSLKKFLSSDGILVYLLMALRCGISRLGATNLLNFCYIQKFSKPFLFTSQRNILNPKLEFYIVFIAFGDRGVGNNEEITTFVFERSVLLISAEHCRI